jgi:dTMP kinase
MSERRGRFVTFEGIDGAGKSTQIGAAVAYLEARGVPVRRTREPGGTPLAERLRELLLAGDMDAGTETLLIFAARQSHLAELIRPALARGDWVVSDRFTDATYAYQCAGRGVPPEQVAALERWVHGDLQPDLTLLIDVHESVAAARLGGARARDRFEREREPFFARVRAAYRERAAAAAARFCVIDGARDPAVVRAAIEAALETLIEAGSR